MLSPPLAATVLDTTAGTRAYLKMPGATWQQDNVTIRKGDYTKAKAYVHFLANPPGYAGYDIQYWLFYAVRGFSAVRIHLYGYDPGFDLLAPAEETLDQGVGEHQGDWKHVTVRIDQNGALQGVFYAQHTGGYWLLPPDMPPSPTGRTTTPLCIQAAIRIPACRTRGASINSAAASASRTSVAVCWRRPPTGATPGTRGPASNSSNSTNPAWLNYKGQWGPAESHGIAITSIVNQGIDQLPWILRSLARRFTDFIAEQVPTLIHRGQRSVDTPSNQDPWAGGDAGFHPR